MRAEEFPHNEVSHSNRSSAPSRDCSCQAQDSRPMTELVSAFDCRPCFDAGIARFAASVRERELIIVKARSEFGAQIGDPVPEDEIPSFIHDVAEAIQKSTTPPHFHAEHNLFGYFWTGVRYRILGILERHARFAKYHKRFDGDDAEERGRTLANTIPATTYGAVVPVEILDLKIGFERGVLGSATNRDASVIRVMASEGYQMDQISDRNYMISQFVKPEIREYLADRYGMSFVRCAYLTLASLPDKRSLGAIGNASSAGKRLLASLCDRTPAADAKRPRSPRPSL